ncbi:hypothetical protein [Streptomyces filipinensis]|uniref:hypothetical protein n=1 Tax=Streptomyces filipinensis TaxID=66887 RepID=UPI001780B0FE|nr:hypothetical protein [Streptomyces filipinensis]
MERTPVGLRPCAHDAPPLTWRRFSNAFLLEYAERTDGHATRDLVLAHNLGQ